MTYSQLSDMLGNQPSLNHRGLTVTRFNGELLEVRNSRDEVVLSYFSNGKITCHVGRPIINANKFLPPPFGLRYGVGGRIFWAANGLLNLALFSVGDSIIKDRGVMYITPAAGPLDDLANAHRNLYIREAQVIPANATVEEPQLKKKRVRKPKGPVIPDHVSEVMKKYFTNYDYPRT